ncbi:hypothetical protein ACWGBO_16125, partial [[Kitasatospora] papulosa]
DWGFSGKQSKNLFPPFSFWFLASFSPLPLGLSPPLDHLVPDPAAALHALLVHGLVRPAGAHLPERFTALQLVRLLHLRDRTPAAARAC